VRKRKRVWVFYRWMRTDLHKGWVYIVSSKVSWQDNKRSMNTHMKVSSGFKYHTQVLAESTDRELLQQMWDLTKET
jgi:hypothetical protein